jgi:myo-inositol 2-dehydrogenase/D-chiro-inositol 1-dehydrogenase
MDRYIPSYQTELSEFVEAIVNDQQPPVTGQDARVPVVMAKASLLSYRENRPVKLAEIK